MALETGKFAQPKVKTDQLVFSGSSCNDGENNKTDLSGFYSRFGAHWDDELGVRSSLVRSTTW